MGIRYRRDQLRGWRTAGHRRDRRPASDPIRLTGPIAMSPRYLGLVAALAASAASAQTAFFNDPTDTIIVDGQTEIATTCTYEAVILFPSEGAAAGRIFNEWTIFNEDKLLYAGPAVIGGWNFPSGTALEAPVSAALDAWHHVAFVYDGAEERLYFDGALVASRALVQSVGNGLDPAFIGAIARDGLMAPSQIGYLQSLRLSSVARYAGPSFPPPLGDLASDANTLLLFNFTEPAGSTTVQDSGPLGRVGTLGVGFPEATPPQLGPVVANEPGSDTPASMVLHAPTPNPVVGTTSIRYELAEPATVRLAVYDALGREVTVLAYGARPAGAHAAPLDASRLPAGVYVARLASDRHRASVRVAVGGRR